MEHPTGKKITFWNNALMEHLQCMPSLIKCWSLSVFVETT